MSGTAIWTGSTPLQPPITRRTATTGNTPLQPPRARAPPRARTAKHNVAYEKEPSPFVIYDTNSDVYEDVIICVSTVDEQQPRYLGENHTGPGTILDSDFLGHVDPALLAP
ncbi:hypothetical protein P885DRAFT_78959 [Corynascus similis CBS 632.67]